MTEDLGAGPPVDWDVAAGLGGRLARPGPAMSDYTRDQAIAELAEASRRAEPPVREVTGLITDDAVPDAMIVDRPRWIASAADSMRAMLTAARGPDPEKTEPKGRLAELTAGLAARAAGAQSGAVLAFVSSGILGQYDPFGSHDDGRLGRLLLVYPNIVAVERQLQVRPSDFRLWVCLHEVTHRVQFTANPWLAGYMSDTLGVLTRDTGEDVLAMVSRMASFVREHSGEEPGGIVGLMRAAQAEPQREALDRLLVLGTLLEGHADHVMDAVGPAVVPAVETIRDRFEQRRHRHQPPLQRLLRALLGMDAKLAQYTRGKKFVDAVVEQVGTARFNAVWTGPETLPLPAEIDHPQRWIDRVL